MELVIKDYKELSKEYPYGCTLKFSEHGPIHITKAQWFKDNISDETQCVISKAVYVDSNGKPIQPYGMWVGFKNDEDFTKFCLTWK